MTDTPAHYTKAQRRLLTAIGGLGVAALAGATFVLSYDDLRTLAIRGGAVHHRAFLYPGIVDGLVAVVILSILATRRASWWSRAVRWLLLLLLVAGAGAAGVERAVGGYRALPRGWVAGGVAAAPWVVLLVAVWLWTSMIKQVLRARRGRPAATPPRGAAGEAGPTVMDGDIVPGLAREDAAGTRPLPRPATVRELGPARPDAGDAVTETTATPGRDAEPAAGPQGEAVPSEAVSPEAVPSEAGEPHPVGRTAPPPLWDDPPRSSGQGDPHRPWAAARRPLLEEPRVTAPDSEATAPRMVARPFLPTDVRLVGPPAGGLGDTQPDGIKLPDTDPDGIPILGTARRDAGDPAEGESAAEADGQPAGHPAAAGGGAASRYADGAGDAEVARYADGPGYTGAGRANAGEGTDARTGTQKDVSDAGSSADEDAGEGTDAHTGAYGSRAAEADPSRDEDTGEPASDDTSGGQDAGVGGTGPNVAPPPPSGTFRSSPTPPRRRG